MLVWMSSHVNLINVFLNVIRNQINWKIKWCLLEIKPNQSIIPVNQKTIKLFNGQYLLNNYNFYWHVTTITNYFMYEHENPNWNLKLYMSTLNNKN